MQLLQSGSQGAPTMPAKNASVGIPGYANNLPGTQQPSRWDADTANTVLAEIINVIAAASIALDVTNNAQLLAAIRALFLGGFSHSTTSGGMIHKFPDGIIDLSFTTLVNFSGAGYLGNTVTYPIPFPNNTFDIQTSYSGNTPPLGGVTVSAELIDPHVCQITTNSTGFGVSGVVAVNVRVRGN